MNKGGWFIMLIPVLLTWYFTRSYYTGTAAAPSGFVKDSVSVVFDTVPYLDTTRPVIIAANPVPVPADVDTAAVLKDYFTRKRLKDSLQVNDVRIKVDYNLLANNLETASWEVVNLRPTEVQYFSARDKPNRIGAGILMGRNFAAPSLQYSYKDLQLQLGYNLVQDRAGPVWFIGLQYSFLAW